MNLLLDVMLNDPDPELGTANQLTNTIRILLDPENMLRSATEKPDFLGFFYRDCMPKLTRFLAQTATGPRQDDYKSAHRYFCHTKKLFALKNTITGPQVRKNR